MDKRGTALRNFLVFLFLMFLFGTIVAGGYSYYLITKDRERLTAKDKEIERLTQSANFLTTKLGEAETRKKAAEDATRALEAQSKKYESEKKVVLDQVRTAVGNFDTYRKESADEIERLKKSVGLLETERKNLKERAESSESLSKEVKEKLTAQIDDLSKKIENGRKEEKALVEHVENMRKTPVIQNAFKLHYNLGNFYFRQGQYKAAVYEYKTALAYAPEDLNANFNLALTSDEYLRDSKTAIQYYKKYLELNPHGADAQNVETRLLDLEAAEKVMHEKLPPEKPMEFFDVEGRKAKDLSMAGERK